MAWEADGEAECFEVADLGSKETYIFKVGLCSLYASRGRRRREAVFGNGFPELGSDKDSEQPRATSNPHDHLRTRARAHVCGICVVCVWCV